MKVFQTLGTAANGLAIAVQFVGVCALELPRRPWLVVQQGEEIVEIYRLTLQGGVPVVMLEPNQSPEYLPGFMSEADCFLAMQAAASVQPEHATT